MKRVILGFAFGALLTLTACHRSPALPNPVESKDGVSYIPIDDTAFLIPEKTWLKGTGRNSTDGLVCCIDLHATIPDVQPWSKERQEEMYWKHGPGKRLDVYLKGDRADQMERFYDIPQSIFSVSISSMVEEPSELAAQGLRKYREYWPAYSEKDAEAGLAQFGAAHVESRRRSAGKPMMDSVYYELLEDGRMKYFIRCRDGSGGLFEVCHLYFPVSKTIIAEVHFAADHLKHVVAMADKLSAKLHEFQAAGLTYRLAQSSNTSKPNSEIK